MPDEVSALVLRIADGDTSAFDALYDAIGPRVDAVCARILGPGPDAEDAAQAALSKVFEQSRRYDPDRGPAMGWVLTVTCWEARTVRRRRQRQREEPAGPELPEHPRTEDEDPEGEVRALLERVSEADRQVILASLEQGERPAIGAAAFRKRLQRALGRLRAALGVPT